MLPTRPFTLPSRARIVRFAAPVTIVSLIATACVCAGLSAPASAATAGTYEIGANPVALNQPSDAEMGALTPSAAAADDGMFGSLAAWPIVALHATLTRNGDLVTYGTPQNTVAQAGVVWDKWTPSSGLGLGSHIDSGVMGSYDSFCNAAVTLADGRLLMVSGQVWDARAADMMTMIYDPTTGAQTMGADLAYKRWYPTALRLPDNRILLLGGANAGNTGAYLTPNDNSKVAFTPEIGTGMGAWTQLTGAASTDLFGAVDNHWWYPRAFNAPNGGVVGFSGDAIWTLDPNGNGSAQQVGTLPYNPKVSGSQVMYAPGKILVAGGGQVNNDDPATATNQTAMLDVNGATPTATPGSPMNAARNWLNLTVLPDGKVFANGGTIIGTQGGDANSVRKSEIWDPAASAVGGWQYAATAQATRTYHSTSVLLPSGAVFTGGGGNPGPVDNFNAELYYPAYLFTKAADGSVKWASRPTITAMNGSATYGGTVGLTIGDGRDIASASLISVPAVTHSQNTDQRRIPLAVTQNGATVNATLPGSINTMPPGDYELTVVDSKGVPSPAQIITIRNGAPGLVTVAAAPAADAANDAGAPAANGTAPGKGAGTGAGAGTLPTTGTAGKTVKLTTGSSLSLSSAAKTGYSVSRSGSKVVLKKVTSASSSSARKATSWIVRSGLGSKKGYSLESVARPGYFLVAPKKGSGSVTLAKLSRTSAFAKRATFTAVPGALGRGLSLRLTANPALYLRTTGTTVQVKKLTETNASHKGATFVSTKGLAR
ncbi:AbfB domain-containing protein [uncultured Amnibacterium sp.]|uniref:AbfB domain-containing protein n=1 Tax=uncultured Amnibacterium sp. TaxID=1631851 RepID=UPI0035CBCE08